MHTDVLTESQRKLFPLLREMNSSFGLVGGTAIALQLGHRRSIDFDLFTHQPFDSLSLRDIIRKKHQINQTMIDTENELTLAVDGVKLTFYKYPYVLNYSENLEEIIKMPSVITLAAMKAFAIGRRAKWKDYVDLYFVMKEYGFASVLAAAHEIFGEEFNEKTFRSQLCYFDDIDYSEHVEYLLNDHPADEAIRDYLVSTATE